MRNRKKISLLLYVSVILFVYSLRVLIIPRLFYLTYSEEMTGRETLLNALMQYAVLLLGSFALGIKEREDISREVFLGTKKWIYYIILGVMLYYSFQFLTNGLIMVITEHDKVVAFSDSNIRSIIFIIIIQVGWAALAEELWYRNSVFRLFPFENFIVGAIFTSLLFCLVHQSIEQKIHSFCLSLLLCYILKKEKNIVPCIIVHATFNLLGIFYSFVMHEKVGFLLRRSGALAYYNARSGGIVLVCMAIILLAIVYVIIWKNWKHSSKKLNTYEV